MKNKKLIILVVLSIAAVISLIYGIISPPRTRRRVSAIQQESSAETAKRIIPAERHAKRSNYTTWGRNPFASAEVPEKVVIELTLNGIMWDEENPLAIINNEMVGIGDEVTGNTIVDIKKDKVILNDGTGNFELRLAQ